MCGVFGFDLVARSKVSKAALATLVASLAINNEERGAQSWGSYAPLRDLLVKKVGPITGAGGMNIPRQAEERLLLGHTRYATVGAITEANAHPFRLAGGLVGQHNGVVYNHAALDKKYGKEPVDSRHLLRCIEEGRDLSEIEAYGSVQYVLPGQRDRVYLGRFNGGELSVARVPGLGTVWSSTGVALRRALDLSGLSKGATFYKVEEGTLYVSHGGELWVHAVGGLPITQSWARGKKRATLAWGSPVVYSRDESDEADEIRDTRDDWRTDPFYVGDTSRDIGGLFDDYHTQEDEEMDEFMEIMEHYGERLDLVFEEWTVDDLPRLRDLVLDSITPTSKSKKGKGKGKGKGKSSPQPVA
jgi:hypothetical protein